MAHQFQGAQQFHNLRADGFTETATSGPELTRVDPTTGARMPSLDELRSKFFGMPRRNIPVDPYGSHARETQILPEAWKDTAGGFINQLLIRQVTSADLWYMREVLPWKEYNGGATIKISQFIFNDHLLDRIPEMGVGRLVTTKFNEWTAAIPRSGLAFQMENGFAMTPKGIQQYLYSCLQIKNATLDTLALDCIYALLNAPRCPDDYYKLFNVPYPEPDLNRLFETETQLWGILNKSVDGYLLMEQIGKDALMRQRVRADTLILSYGTKAMYRLRDTPNTEHWRGGDKGVAQKTSAGGPIAAEATMRVREVGMFITGEDNMPEDPLVRRRSTGEFFQMPAKDTLDMPAEEYRTHYRNTSFLDCERDQIVAVSFKEALQHCGMWDANGKKTGICEILTGTNPSWASYFSRYGVLNQVSQSFRLRRDMLSAHAQHSFASLLHDGNEGEADIADTTWDDVCEVLDHDIKFPISLLLARPHMLSYMSAAIMCKAGAETGHTYIGQSDFELGIEVADKTLLGFWTCYAGCVVHSPANVYILHNVRCHDACVKGSGTRMWHPYIDHHIEEYKSGILSNDLFCLAIQPTECIRRSCIDLTGYFPDNMLDRSTVQDGAMHYSSAITYRQRWGWMRCPQYIDVSNFHNRHGVASCTRCFQGTQWFYGHTESGNMTQFGSRIDGLGHWGKTVYGGVRRDRCGRGENRFVKSIEMPGQPYVF
jgi:hypothetical protein